MKSQYPDAYDRLLDAAKARAVELRARAIDQFWNDAGCTARRALRSANRLAHRVQRHNDLRGQS